MKNWRASFAFVARVMVYAGYGALACALAGAVLVSASMASVGWIFNHLPFSKMTPVNEGALVGSYVGCLCGGLMGISVCAATGLFLAPPLPPFPSWTVLSRVVWGMGGAVAFFLASLFCVAEVIEKGRHLFFLRLLEAILHNSHFLTFGLPAVMMCGQIVGAMWGFRSEKAGIYRIDSLRRERVSD